MIAGGFAELNDPRTFTRGRSLSRTRVMKPNSPYPPIASREQLGVLLARARCGAVRRAPSRSNLLDLLDDGGQRQTSPVRVARQGPRCSGVGAVCFW